MHLWIEVTVLRQFCTVCAQMQKAVYFFAMPSLCSRMLLGIHFRNCFLHLIILMRSLIVTLDDSGFDVLSCKNYNDNHITQKNSHSNKINELPKEGFLIKIESWGDVFEHFGGYFKWFSWIIQRPQDVRKSWMMSIFMIYWVGFKRKYNVASIIESNAD